MNIEVEREKVPTPPIKTITLKLTVKEASALRRIHGSIGGLAKGYKPFITLREEDLDIHELWEVNTRIWTLLQGEGL